MEGYLKNLLNEIPESNLAEVQIIDDNFNTSLSNLNEHRRRRTRTRRSIRRANSMGANNLNSKVSRKTARRNPQDSDYSSRSVKFLDSRASKEPVTDSTKKNKTGVELSERMERHRRCRWDAVPSPPSTTRHSLSPGVLRDRKRYTPVSNTEHLHISLDNGDRADSVAVAAVKPSKTHRSLSPGIFRDRQRYTSVSNTEHPRISFDVNTPSVATKRRQRKPIPVARDNNDDRDDSVPAAAVKLSNTRNSLSPGIFRGRQRYTSIADTEPLHSSLDLTKPSLRTKRRQRKSISVARDDNGDRAVMDLPQRMPISCVRDNNDDRADSAPATATKHRQRKQISVVRDDNDARADSASDAVMNLPQQMPISIVRDDNDDRADSTPAAATKRRQRKQISVARDDNNARTDSAPDALMNLPQRMPISIVSDDNDDRADAAPASAIKLTQQMPHACARDDYGHCADTDHFSNSSSSTRLFDIGDVPLSREMVINEAIAISSEKSTNTCITKASSTKKPKRRVRRGRPKKSSSVGSDPGSDPSIQVRGRGRPLKSNSNGSLPTIPVRRYSVDEDYVRPRVDRCEMPKFQIPAIPVRKRSIGSEHDDSHPEEMKECPKGSQKYKIPIILRDLPYEPKVRSPI